jgi:hypothetical protein
MMATGGDCGEGKGRDCLACARIGSARRRGRPILISARARVGGRHFTGARERIVALSRGRNIDIYFLIICDRARFKILSIRITPPP